VNASGESSFICQKRRNSWARRGERGGRETSSALNRKKTIPCAGNEKTGTKKLELFTTERGISQEGRNEIQERGDVLKDSWVFPRRGEDREKAGIPRGVEQSCRIRRPTALGKKKAQSGRLIAETRRKRGLLPKNERGTGTLGGEAWLLKSQGRNEQIVNAKNLLFRRSLAGRKKTSRGKKTAFWGALQRDRVLPVGGGKRTWGLQSLARHSTL